MSDKDGFDPDKTAEVLKEAMDGFGTNEGDILNVLGNHSNKQRLLTAEAFKVLYGKDLIDELKSELGGDFETLCVALLIDPRQYDARELHDAISGAGTDEKCLIDIMCTRDNDEMKEIKEKYKEEFESELEEDLQADTGGYFRRLMISLCVGGRDYDNWWCANEDKAVEDAQKFLEAGENAWGTEEADMNAILCRTSPAQLCKTIEKYEELTEGKTMEESIRSECSDDLQDGYLAIVESARSMPRYFARRLNDCFSGLGTSDNDLIRIIVSRSEVDMEAIKQAYEEMYEKPLTEAVESECGGDYKRLLLAILNPPY